MPLSFTSSLEQNVSLNVSKNVLLNEYFTQKNVSLEGNSTFFINQLQAAVVLDYPLFFCPNRAICLFSILPRQETKQQFATSAQ